MRYSNCIVQAERLYSVHKIFLHPVEDHDAEDVEEDYADEAVDQPAPADEFAGTEETVFEGLDDRRDGVEAHKRVHRYAVPLHACSLGEGIDDRRRVHPELDDETEEDLKVAVFGGHSGYDRAETKR